MSEPRMLGEVRSYDDLVLLMRDRAEELGINRLTLDEVAGLPRGYSSKVLAFPPIKVMGRLSFDLLMQALAIQFHIVEDKSAVTAFANQRDKRKGKGGHSKPLRMKNGALNFAEIMRGLGKRGGKKRARVLTKKQRAASARRAGRIRWRKERQRQRAKREADRASRRQLKALPAPPESAIAPMQTAGTVALINQDTARSRVRQA